MITEDQIKTYLEQISPNCVILKFEFTSAEKFIVHLKCDIEKDQSKEFYDELIQNWVTNFAQFTATKWSAHCSYVKIKTLLMQKVFVCQVADNNITKEPPESLKCDAEIDFKIKLMNVNEDLNMFITIQFDHSHNVYTHVTDSALSSTDKLFFEYFDNGFNVTTSKVYHELSLVEKYGSRSAQYIADEEINPSLEHIKSLIDQMQSKEIRRSFGDILEAKKAFIEDSGGVLTYSKKPEIVVVISPLMKKVISNNNLECLIVDSSVIKAGLVVTYLYVSNKIGALPVACMLHTEASKQNFMEVFKRMKAAIKTVNKNFKPKIFIINDIKEQRQALSHYFRHATLVTSRWSICCEIWKWLCNENPELSHSKRHGLMYLFKTFVYAPEHQARDVYDKVASSHSFVNNPRAMRHLEALWNRCYEWQGRPDARLHDLTETSIRLLKEFLLRKCRFFNVIMMIDVVSKLLEDHQSGLILKYIDGTPKISNYTKFFHRAYMNHKNEQVLQIRSNTYVIENRASLSDHHYLYTVTTCCDCTLGKMGRVCDHLAMLMSKNNIRAVKVPLLNCEEVDTLVKLLETPKEILNRNEEPTEVTKVTEVTEVTEVTDDDFTVITVNQEPEADKVTTLNQEPKAEKETEKQVKKEKQDKIQPATIMESLDISSLLSKINAMQHVYGGEDTTITKHFAIPVQTGLKRKTLRYMQRYRKAFKQMSKNFQRLQLHYLMDPSPTNLVAIRELTSDLAKMNAALEPNLNREPTGGDQAKNNN